MVGEEVLVEGCLSEDVPGDTRELGDLLTERAVEVLDLSVARVAGDARLRRPIGLSSDDRLAPQNFTWLAISLSADCLL
jgi:hypothetical protein